MKLALRRSYPKGGSLLDRLATWVVKYRLVTRYPHAGIVIGDTLYHATSKHGLIAVPAEMDGWVLLDVGGDDERALALFHEWKGAAYDWFSLLAFVGLKARDSRRFYCYEWCHMAMVGEHPTGRVTPESLLMIERAKE